MKIGVCGDSFMSAISYDKNNLDNGCNKHFTEILAKKLECDIITFARGACSNQAIRLQIDEVIKEKPDLVIIGTTSIDRMELPFKNNLYEKINGLYNIEYLNWIDKSSENINFSKITPTMFSETLNNIFNKVQYPKNILNDDEIEILKNWFDRFYDYNWKMQQDSWIIANGLRKLQDNNIKYYCINNCLIDSELKFNNDDNIINSNSELNPWNHYSNINVPYRFHTTLESQEKLANLWYDKIIKEI